MATIHPPDLYSRQLDHVRKFALGFFDTQLPCNCGKETVKDHATEINLNAPASWEQPRFGPSPTHRERLNAFGIAHEYYCNGCGVTYKAEVVEKIRGYQPKTKDAVLKSFQDKTPTHDPYLGRKGGFGSMS